MANSKNRVLKGQHVPQSPLVKAGSNNCSLFVCAVTVDAVIFKRVETGQELRLELLDFTDGTCDFGVLVSEYIKSRLADDAKYRPLVSIGDPHCAKNSILMQRLRHLRDKLVAHLKRDGHAEMATALAKLRMRDLLGNQSTSITSGLSDQGQETHKQSYRNLTLAEQYLRNRNGN